MLLTFALLCWPRSTPQSQIQSLCAGLKYERLSLAQENLLNIVFLPSVHFLWILLGINFCLFCRLHCFLARVERWLGKHAATGKYRVTDPSYYVITHLLEILSWITEEQNLDQTPCCQQVSIVQAAEYSCCRILSFNLIMYKNPMWLWQACCVLAELHWCRSVHRKIGRKPLKWLQLSFR